MPLVLYGQGALQGRLSEDGGGARFQRWPDEDVVGRILEDVNLRAVRVTLPGRHPFSLVPKGTSYGRYHDLRDMRCIYASIRQETAVEELERHGAPLASVEILRALLDFTGRILNITNRAGWRALRISRSQLVEDDVNVCRQIARLALSLNADGILAPSAADDFGINLVVFRRSMAKTLSLIDVDIVLA